MRSRALIAAACVALLVSAAACAVDPAPPRLTLDGYGTVRFGDSLAATETKLGEKAKEDTHLSEGDCRIVKFRRFPKVYFMVEKGIVTRVDFDVDVPNALDARIGAPSAELEQRFPGLEITPGPYDPNGRNLILRSADRAHAIVVTDSEGKIRDVRAGAVPSVFYDEGCS